MRAKDALSTFHAPQDTICQHGHCGDSYSGRLCGLQGVDQQSFSLSYESATVERHEKANILVFTTVNDLSAQTELSSRERSRWFDLRLLAGTILLLPAIWFTWRTMDGLAERRDFRTDLAELNTSATGC